MEGGRLYGERTGGEASCYWCFAQHRLLRNELDAVCFTTAIQVRSLFEFAREQGYLADIVHSFQTNVLAVAVGKVTAEALKEECIEKLLAPEYERVGAMIIELSRYYEKQLRIN